VQPVIPSLQADSVVDGVTFNPYTSLGPGSIVAISGQNLAETIAIATGSSLPPVLATTRALLADASNEIALPLVLVAPTQVRALVPSSVLPGIYKLRVEVASVRSNEIQITVAAFDPGIFTVNGTGKELGFFFKDDGSQITSANPAAPGSIVTLYAAGLGAVNAQSRTVLTPLVFFDRYAGQVSFSGLDIVQGRYRVTVRVPAQVPASANISVSLTIGGFASNRVTIPVR
jgi:uncharacterized protein (TIGR03437 family)